MAMHATSPVLIFVRPKHEVLQALRQALLQGSRTSSSSSKRTYSRIASTGAMSWS